MYVFEFIFLLAFPFVLACGASYLTWRELSRPVLFLIVSAVVLYVLYAALMWLLDPGLLILGYQLTARRPGEAPISEPLFLLLPFYEIPLIAFALAALPVLAVLLRVFKRGGLK
jgi:hypothetical protein